MSHITLTRPDLFSQTQVAGIIGVDRHTVRGVALALHLQYKSDPTRAGKMLNREDVDRIAARLDISVNWDALASA